MAKTLEKTRKQIAKKRNGTIDALHKFSRDSKRLHKAQVRDERLSKVAAVRKKQDRPLINRVTYFHAIVEAQGWKPLEAPEIRSKINQFVCQYDEEFEAVKKERRPGRPSSVKEDLLKRKVEALKKESLNGFYMPDLTKKDNIDMLEKWDSSWSHLTNLSWVRIAEDGTIKAASFPPKG